MISVQIPKHLVPSVERLIELDKEATEKRGFFGKRGVVNEYRDSRLAFIHKERVDTEISK